MSYTWRFVSGSLVEFDQHAAGLHVIDETAGAVESEQGRVEEVCTARIQPPTSAAVTDGAVACPEVVVLVQCGELHPVGVPVRLLSGRQGIPGVSAVPGHRQSVLTDLSMTATRIITWQ